MKKTFTITLLTLILLSCCSSSSVLAAAEVQKQLLPTSPFYTLVKVKESIQQFLTFRQSSKATLLEGFADQRVEEMNYASSIDDHNALDLSLDRYQKQKTQAIEYAEGTSDSVVVDKIKEGTLNQQKEMTKMQLQVEGSAGVQQRIVEVQKEVAVEVKKTVQIVQGTEKAIELDEKTHYIWLDPNVDASGNLPPLPDELIKWEYAPGTEGRDTNNRIIETILTPEIKETNAVDEATVVDNKIEIQWAPGTEGKGESGVQYKDSPKIVIQDAEEENSDDGKEIQVQQAPGAGAPSP
ncbi:hypothetical protein KJ596_01860 [Patescibacteria group bacterium]|nr:hypothetical protein [Patescibacteria group bacterium]MBU1868211.1 hypothetical protein [Patescibacteria group bacterium]